MEPPVMFKVLRLDAKLDAATYAMVVVVVVAAVVFVLVGRTFIYFPALILHSYSASCPVSAFRLWLFISPHSQKYNFSYTDLCSEQSICL
jgi:hypothetical protein